MTRNSRAKISDVNKKIHDIEKTIKRNLKAWHKHDSFRSWEQCYRFFAGIDRSDFNADEAALRLAFYLASWGMYRGSSFLRELNYQVHIEAIDILKEYSHLRTSFKEMPSDEKKGTLVDQIFKASWKLRRHYEKIVREANVKKQRGVTDTLVTKILMGTLGCTPAFDRYVKIGLKKCCQKFTQRYSEKNLNNIINFYHRHSNEFRNSQTHCSAQSARISTQEHPAITYPPMKVIDMYFWSVGKG